MLNLVYNFDFYATSATQKEKDILKFIILKNYLFLKFKAVFIKNKHEQPIEIFKALLLLNSIINIKTDKIIEQINKQINSENQNKQNSLADSIKILTDLSRNDIEKSYNIDTVSGTNAYFSKRYGWAIRRATDWRF